jgi:hypothetical protein
LDHFSSHPKTKDGLQSICKECNRKLALKRAKRLSTERKKEQGLYLDYREDKSKLDYQEPPTLDYKDPYSGDMPMRSLHSD